MSAVPQGTALVAPETVIQGIDYLAIAPPLLVAVAAVAALVADAFGAPRRAIGLISGGGLLAGLVAVAVLVPRPERRTFCVPAGLRGTGPASCSYVADDFTLLFQALLAGAAIVVLLLALGEIAGGGDGGAARPLPAGEFHFLFLAAVAGALTLVASRDLIMLVVSLETLSLPVFALVALRRYDGTASEAALKLFLVSVVSAAVTLFGISLVYGVAGTVHLDRLAEALARTPAGFQPAAAVAAVLVLAGFAFKVAAVPFHFWAPDVYQGSPLPVAAFLSVVSKAAGFAGLILVLVGFGPYAPVWGVVAGLLAAATMTVGNLVALRQRHAVRLLAWSSVAQSGYMLAPLAVGATDRDRLGGAVAATVAYVAMYAVMNIGAFAVVTAVAGHRAGHALDGYRGLARTNPLSAAALAFFLICLAGLPPGLMGLFAKVTVFRATVAGAATWLAVVMAVNTVIGLYYYLGWVARLYRAPAGEGEVAPARPGRSAGLAVAVAAAGAVVLSFAPQLVLHVTPFAALAVR